MWTLNLIDVARETGAQIIVPTGGLLGLDAVTAACEGTIHSVVLITRKPIASDNRELALGAG